MVTQQMGLLEKDTESLDVEEEAPNTRQDWTRSLSYAAHCALTVVKPSFLSRKSDKKNGKLRRTAYLDGLRGFAAFLVYWHHHCLWAHEAMESEKRLQNGWGYEGQYYFATLPGIRVFVNGGHFAVATFFVLSGYVLSTKPLALINAGEYTKLGDNVASALFRRWLRLYLPILATTFMMVCLWHIFGIWGNFIPEPNFRAGIWKWYIDLKSYTFIFRTGGEPWIDYNPHTWSIPVEFKGSIVIYTAVMAFSRCTRKARFWGELALVYYFMYIADGAHFAMFMAGMMIADFDLTAMANELPSWLTNLSFLEQPVSYFMLFMALVLGSVPSFSAEIQVLRETPGWYAASKIVPQAVFDYKWFFLFWAAICMILSSGRIPWLKRFFETRFCLYLCRISYMLYLVHGPILWTLGDRLYAAVGWTREQQASTIPHWVNRMPMPRVGPYALEFAFFVPHIILLPFTLLVAEIATAVIDNPSLRFSAWLYSKFEARPEEDRRNAENRA
ncbi:hypothetical protein KC331_g2151 [Hortaea werneckii]|uniref:Acyltransferase 3 domain-containing protein n=1 Tax=Hortaea werneckii TaxID=91943 RepID=A0A3M7BLK9_HORWE|nr:hypothetical protein KC331_g2151 [Hortaea werneckii]KAI7720360.1 hypothetical protein KC353_g2254 [Hortaea werneckii]RMY40437.1 hypothetical protein D0865_12560 [Hortaea werneckii]